ncbi:MAG: YebC/PmpR family DNA-binding transcriptional regulator, partial [Firmicutes bacterium]|nr:YebC/PmpR family DNA-binding transcriptional regulator [Bacillota bacterium]
LLEILTDNRNRTASEIRNLFSRNESSLGESGCVSWMFQRKGYLNIAAREEDDEDEIMLMAVDAGAEDFELEDGFYNVITAPEELEIVKDRLSAKGLEISSAEITMLPESTVPIEDKETAAKVLRLIEALEDHDDVKNVYCNCEIPEEFYPE